MECIVQQTQAQIRSQFVDDIFDVNYTPGSVDDTHLFNLKKRFMYIVFTNTLLTDKGNNLINKYEGDYNTHAIHKELLTHMLTLTKASVVSSTILTYITTVKFQTVAWNGSSESFTLHWLKQASEYEILMDITDRLSDTTKRAMLENDVDRLAERRNVKKTATQIQITSGTILSYDGYVSLLYSATQSCDTQFATRINSK